jgi:tetratricopeptide (TPR) repeat protein
MTPFARQLGRRVALGVALVLLFAGCGGLRSQVSQQFTQARRAQVSYHDGLARYEAQDYPGAIPLFERAQANDPPSTRPASLAWSYYHVGNYPQATRHFRQALRASRWVGLHRAQVEPVSGRPLPPRHRRLPSRPRPAPPRP